MAADASIAADAEASLLLSELAWSFSPFLMKLIQAFVQSRQQRISLFPMPKAPRLAKTAKREDRDSKETRPLMPEKSESKVLTCSSHSESKRKHLNKRNERRAYSYSMLDDPASKIRISEWCDDDQANLDI
jgi:hypothetical protein